jgi:hypothetical protein
MVYKRVKIGHDFITVTGLRISGINHYLHPGSVKTNLLPAPGVLSAKIWPPFFSINSLQGKKPIPDPFSLFFPKVESKEINIILEKIPDIILCAFFHEYLNTKKTKNMLIKPVFLSFYE